MSDKDKMYSMEIPFEASNDENALDIMRLIGRMIRNIGVLSAMEFVVKKDADNKIINPGFEVEE